MSLGTCPYHFVYINCNLLSGSRDLLRRVLSSALNNLKEIKLVMIVYLEIYKWTAALLGQAVESGVWVIPKTWQSRRSYLNLPKWDIKEWFILYSCDKICCARTSLKCWLCQQGTKFGCQYSSCKHKSILYMGIQRVLEFGLELESEQINPIAGLGLEN